jgi:TolB-like protein
MKTRNFTQLKGIMLALIFSTSLWVNPLLANDSDDLNKESIAVINIDCKGIEVNMTMMTSLVTLELERLDKFEVIDKYDVANHMQANNFAMDKAYGKTMLIKIGEKLNVDKILSGSVEKFGGKIIVVFRLVDIKSKKIQTVDVMEYIDQQENIQDMVRISLHNIFKLENDKNTVDMLSNFNPPLSNTKSTVKLNGPRFGASMTFGANGDRLQASRSYGGFDMYPVSSVFGYQKEFQYVSAGEFQALLEFVGTFNALESGYLIPSLSVINGFRFNRLGLEFGIGPVFRAVRTAEGYYDADQNWIIADEFTPSSQQLVSRIDHRGVVKMSTGLIIAAGFTIKSGYINFPINVYVSPRKEGTVVGLMFGFNVAKTRKQSHN